MGNRRAFTFVELLVVVMISGILTAVAIPRFHFGLVHRSRAEVAAWDIVSALRRTRSLAILNAATHPDGYGLNIQTIGENSTYQIVDLGTFIAVDSHMLDSGILHVGSQVFEFSSLGALKDTSDRVLTLSTTDTTFTISVVAATGTVKCVESSIAN